MLKWRTLPDPLVTRMAVFANKRSLLVLTTVLVLLAALLFWKTLAVKYYAYRGERLLKARKTAEALSWFQAGARLAPDDPRTNFLMARAFRRLDDYAQALDRLRQSSEAGFAKDRVERELVLTYAQSGQLDRVQREVADLLQNAGEETGEICEALVKGCLRMERFEMATMFLDAWQSDLPEDPMSYLYRGQLLERRDANTQAVEEYRKAHRYDPELTEAWLALAGGLAKLEQWPEAIQFYERFLEQFSDDIPASRGYGSCLRQHGKLAEAEQVLQRLLKADPDDQVTQLEMARLEVDQGKPVEAAARLQPLAKQRPWDAEVRYVLGVALQDTDRIDDAKAHFAFVAEARKQMARVPMLADRAGQQPENVALRHELGVILIKFHDPERGIAWLEAALTLDPKHRPTHLALAEHYERVGDTSQAEKHRALAGGIEK